MDFSKLKSKVFFENKFCKNQNAKIHFLNHSLHFSGAVFEGIRIYNGKILFLNDHIDRFFLSAKLMMLKPKLNKYKVKNICKKLVKINKTKNGYIRPIMYRSNHSMSPDISKCNTKISIAVWEWDNLYKNSLKICVSKLKKINNTFFPVKAKSSASYQGTILSKENSRIKGFDDFLYLDEKQYIKETSACNIFWIKKNKVYTPSKNNILNGITRQVVIKICKIFKIPIIEGNFKLKSILAADNAFVTGTATEIMSISKINKKKFLDDQKIILRLKKEFDQIKTSGLESIKKLNYKNYIKHNKNIF